MKSVCATHKTFLSPIISVAYSYTRSLLTLLYFSEDELGIIVLILIGSIKKYVIIRVNTIFFKSKVENEVRLYESKLCKEEKKVFENTSDNEEDNDGEDVDVFAKKFGYKSRGSEISDNSSGGGGGNSGGRTMCYRGSGNLNKIKSFGMGKKNKFGFDFSLGDENGELSSGLKKKNSLGDIDSLADIS